MTASKCTYRFRKPELMMLLIEDGLLLKNLPDTCEEEVHETSPSYCILHIDFPDENDPEFDKIKSEKDAKVREKLQEGRF